MLLWEELGPDILRWLLRGASGEAALVPGAAANSPGLGGRRRPADTGLPVVGGAARHTGIGSRQHILYSGVCLQVHDGSVIEGVRHSSCRHNLTTSLSC